MFRQVILLSTLSVVLCQYPRNRAPQPPQRYDAEPDYDDYQEPPRPNPPPQPRVSPNAVRLRPASVHYVNIGAELAGDYKFGYDTGKGDGQSFREETRLPDGSVQGAYGYVDETGTQRIVKYVAGKEGFRVLKDNEKATSSASSQPAPQPQPAQAYRPPPQPVQQYNPPPQPARAPAYVPPPQPARQQAPAYQSPRTQPRNYAPQPAYRAPPQPAPQPQPAYRAPPQPAPRPAPQRSYAPEPRAPPRRKYQPVEEPDYDYPDNDIQERRLVPVDTTLFNYNIGTNSN